MDETSGRQPRRLRAALAVLATVASIETADAGAGIESCCADLEERIAELEATAARKGNRKLELSISGQVNEAILFWDDGRESNATLITNDSSRTRLRFEGDARISSDWKAGYHLEIGFRSANSKRFLQDDPSNGSGIDLRHSYWFIESKTFGRLSLGHTGGAAEGVTEINLAQTKAVAKHSDMEDLGLGLAMRLSNGLYSNGSGTSTAGAFTWRRLIRDSGVQPGEGRRAEIVKYETPKWNGFTVVANWGEDDFWETGIRYKGEVAGFRIAAGIAYGENSEMKTASSNVGIDCMAQNAAGIPAGSGRDAHCSQWGGSVSIMHAETGLYANVAAGETHDDLIRAAAPAFATADPTSSFWAVEAGIERDVFKDAVPVFGKTTLFGQYYDLDGGASARTTFAGDAILATGLTSYGGGIVQSIVDKEMQLYALARRYRGSVTTSAGSPGLKPLDIYMAGAIVRF